MLLSRTEAGADSRSRSRLDRLHNAEYEESTYVIGVLIHLVLLRYFNLYRNLKTYLPVPVVKLCSGLWRSDAQNEKQ